MSTERRIYVNNDLDIVMACMQTRELAKQMGFSTADQARISLAASELARVIAWHNNDPGEIVMSGATQNGRQGLQIICRVNPEYIPTGDKTEWAKETAIPNRSLAGACQLTDDSNIEAQNGKHVRVTLTQWLK